MSYKARVIEERNDLRDKIDRLTDFVDAGSVQGPTLDVLKSQLVIMIAYWSILNIRIDSLDDDKGN